MGITFSCNTHFCGCLAWKLETLGLSSAWDVHGMHSGHSRIYPAFEVIIYFLTIVFSYYQGSREQLAIAEFANSLLVIPKTLAVNAAQDSADLVAKLRAYHNTSQINTERSSLKWYVPFEYRVLLDLF